MLVTASPSTVRRPDTFGCLPLHYACASDAPLRVLALLVENYPESRTMVDKRGRTPLHFRLGQADRPAGEEEVSLLSGVGDVVQGKDAPDMADENGMLVSGWGHSTQVMIISNSRCIFIFDLPDGRTKRSNNKSRFITLAPTGPRTGRSGCSLTPCRGLSWYDEFIGLLCFVAQQYVPA